MASNNDKTNMDPTEKENIEQIKNSLRTRLQQSGVNNLIRHMVRDVCSSAAARGDSEKIEPDEIVDELYKRGLMKTVLDNVQWSDNFERELVEKNIASSIKYSNSSKDQKVARVNGHDKNKKAAIIKSTDSKIHVIDEEDEVDDDKNNNNIEPTTKTKTDEPDPDLSEGGGGAGGDENNYSDNSFMTCDDENVVSNEESKTTTTTTQNCPEIVQEVPHDTRVKGRLNGKYYLKFEILKGKSFLDQLFNFSGDEPKLLGQKFKTNFILHVSYKTQRFYTKPTPCQCEPKFQDTFMIDFGYFEDGTVLQLLTNYEPIRIILLQEGADGERKVLSICGFDWRSLLMSNKSCERLPVSLMGIGPESQVLVGVLNTKLTILPSLQEILSASTYAAQINAERSIVDEKERLFLIYVKQWWREFMEIRPQHNKRLVKIFSYDENNTAIPVQTFVKQITADRLLLTPFHAAWFVSLISLRMDSVEDDLYRINYPGQNNAESSQHHAPQVLCDHWQSLLTTITSKSGRVEDHATLLCSFFLGFGLDAYVAIGTVFAGSPWVWVVTLDAANQPTFWQSTDGSRHVHYQSTTTELLSEKAVRLKNSKTFNFKTISCLFNDRLYYANIQASNLIDMVDWDLSNPSKWKKIPESTLKSSSKFNECPPELILPSMTNTVLLATDIEIQLKTLISEIRMKNNLFTYWDNSLGKVLGQELAKYEMEACCGINDIPGYFETAILKKIPGGHEFKGYPWHGNTRHSHKIFQQLMRDPVGQDIIFCTGNDVKLSLRVITFVYPEEVTSVRLMLACKFIPME